jgi:hypothetical protein
VQVVAMSGSEVGRDDIGLTMTEPRCQPGVSG